MAATPTPQPGGDTSVWRQSINISLLYDNKLLLPVDQLRQWGCRFEDDAKPGPQLRLRCELAGRPTMIPTFNLNPPSNLSKRPKCSVPAPSVAALVSLLKPNRNGCFIFGKRHWDGSTLVLDVGYEPPAHPLALPTASEAGAASALGRMQAAAGRAEKQPGPIMVSDSEDDEPLIKRIAGASTKRTQPGQPGYGPAAKQARVSADGAGTGKVAAQAPPTTPAARGAAGVVANGGAAAAAAAASGAGLTTATAAAAVGGSGAEQPPVATPPPAKPGAQLGAAFNSALQRRTSAAAEAAVQEQLLAQLPAVKARLTGEALAELKQQVAVEVERRVAAEVQRQVEQLRTQLAGEMRRAMADEVRRQVADAMAEVQRDFVASTVKQH